jgi:hypothetical protein
MPDDRDTPSQWDKDQAIEQARIDLQHIRDSIQRKLDAARNSKTRNLLTAIEIENFKGIGERVRLELKPITLLFGPNSAGKSTILQALHYAREIFERRNLNADKTMAGGQFVDLGGFLNVVHGHDPLREIKLAFELDLRKISLPTYYNPKGLRKVVDYEELEFAQNIESAKVSISVAMKSFREEITYLVTDYAVEINGEPLARLSTPTLRSGTVLTDINYRHPVFANLEIMGHLAAIADHEKQGYETNVGIVFSELAVEQAIDSLPRWKQCLSLATLADPEVVEAATREFAEAMVAFLDDFNPMMSQLIVGPGEILLKCLQNFRYLGPIREIPPRNYQPPSSPDPSRWASGLAAWDWLASASDKEVQRVSDWLSQEDRLNTGVELVRKQNKRLDMSDRLVVDLMTGRAFDEAEDTRLALHNVPTETQMMLFSQTKNLLLLPHDVGIGISQILPVIVAAMGEEQRLVMIEQPELHVHPRLQAELGDLLIETALCSPDGRHEYLIETHSEHLILRLLRRIRELTEGTSNRTPLTPDDVAVHYLEQYQSGTIVRLLRIDDEGEFIDRWPHGFFAERAKELF